MNLVDALDQYVQIVQIAEAVDNKKDLKKLKNEAKALRKVLEKIDSINIDEAIQIHKILSNVNFDSLRSDREWLNSVLWEIGSLRTRFSEVFMDVDATRVRTQLGLALPMDEEVVRFRVNLSGLPLIQKWSLMLEQTRELIELPLPVLNYEGLAKLSPDLLSINRIGDLIQNRHTYYLGPTSEDHPLKSFPLSMVSSVNVPSTDPKFDLDFVLSASTEVSQEQLRAFRKRNESLDYHPLPNFLVRVKVEGFNDESKEDQQHKRQAVIEILKQVEGNTPADIGWSIAFIRFLGYGFPPILRGSLLPHGSQPPNLPPLVDYLPMTPDEYIQTVLEKFDEDNIIPQEGIIDEIPVISGGTWISHQSTIPIGMPIPLFRTEITVPSYCVTALGSIDNVSLERIKRFSKNSVSFAKDKLPKGAHFVVDIPVLLANEVDTDAKKWVESNIENPYNAMVAPSILDLKNGALYYCKKAPITLRTVYSNIRMFIERYLITEKMRWKKPPDTAKIPKCPHCGAQYRVKEGVSEVTCQNCLKTYSPDSAL